MVNFPPDFINLDTAQLSQLNPGSTPAQSYTGKQATKQNEKYEDDDGDSDSDDTEEDDSAYCKKTFISMI